MKTEVLIVGAGPTGLTMAAELGRRGISCRIIDKNDGPVTESRALAVQSRTVEIFQNMGLASHALERGNPVNGIDWFVNGKKKAALNLADLKIKGAPYPFVLVLSQEDTEKMLEAYVANYDIIVERATELLGFHAEADGVSAELRLPNGQQQVVEARYLVGCDGAHSRVRHELDLPFEGGRYDQGFLLADCKVDWDQPKDRLAFFLAERGVTAFFPFNGQHFGRFIVTDRTHDDSPDVDLDTIAELIRSYTKRDLRLYDPKWTARFRLHHRGVSRYRVGPVFLAGDAAHIHSPAGGQGMNTGIQDSFNLAWKIALVLRGHASDALLDSYHDERHPVGQHLLKRTDRLFYLAASDNWLFTTTRNALVSMFGPVLVGSDAAAHGLFNFIAQLGIRYARSPIVGQDESFSTNPTAGVSPGWRAPDGRMLAMPGEHATSLFEVMRGTEHHLLVFLGPSEEAPVDVVANAEAFVQAQGAGLIKLVVIASSPLPAITRPYFLGRGELTAAYAATEGVIYLVRPDGYVAFRSHDMGLAPLEAYWRQWYDGHLQAVANL